MSIIFSVSRSSTRRAQVNINFRKEYTLQEITFSQIDKNRKIDTICCWILP